MLASPQTFSSNSSLPFYVGVLGGYGSTTWGRLVPNNPNAAMDLSTPIKVNEGGGVWGFIAGYELIPEFGFETLYMHFPRAKLYFDPMSLFTFEHNGRTQLLTGTETIGFVGKFLVAIPNTNLRAFSNVGFGMVHRYDAIKNLWRFTPTFGAGLNYALNQHWMTELVFNYVAGNGESELDPANDFIPFLYSATVRLDYRF